MAYLRVFAVRKKAAAEAVAAAVAVAEAAAAAAVAVGAIRIEPQMPPTAVPCSFP